YYCAKIVTDGDGMTSAEFDVWGPGVL
nr:anti-SIV gp148 Ig heavy chain {CDR3 heavy chain region} [Macaca fascicularis=cynomolgus monkey, Peptide Partial, 26 aa] [Macaca fascicularis]